MEEWLNPQYPKCTPDEYRALLLRAKTGDKAARERFVLANMPLAIREGKRAAYMHRRYGEAEEAIQEASVGLVKALNWYDPEKINPRTGQPYEFSTLAVTLMRDALHTYFRRQRHEFTSEAVPDLPTFDPEYSDLAGIVCDAVRRLYPSGRDIIVKRYWFGMSLSDIGRETGYSGERIRQLHDKAIEQLRSVPLPSESQSL